MTDTPHAGEDQVPDRGPIHADAEDRGAQETAAPGPEGGGAADPVAGAPYETPEETAQRVKELTTDLQRLQAEYVNYKRRVERDRELVLQNAKYSILSALLPVLDDIDRAREHEELEGGFKAIAESLERIVSGEGLVKFGASGDPFDPRHHEALMHSLSPHVTTTTCDKVVQAGYQLGDRVVRPALVTVVDPDPQADEQAHVEPAPAPDVATADEQG
ncbi:MAG TPA: nucleotide exchange factor GrpE [Marmoricola sp.]|nr:nucleotide exchange factor GrpE [Marmoricola sp.]